MCWHQSFLHFIYCTIFFQQSFENIQWVIQVHMYNNYTIVLQYSIVIIECSELSCILLYMNYLVELSIIFFEYKSQPYQFGWFFYCLKNNENID